MLNCTLATARRTSSPSSTPNSTRITVRLGRKRYAIDLSCSARELAPEPDVNANSAGSCGNVIETKFLRLRRAPALGDRIDGWRVCWLGGWDRGRVFYIVMVERTAS
jgi:hypothetical protein